MITYHFIILVKNICVNIRMLQTEHTYRFFLKHLFCDQFMLLHLPNGVLPNGNIYTSDISRLVGTIANGKMLYDVIPKIHQLIFYDQEPLIEPFAERVIDQSVFPEQFSLEYQHEHEGKLETDYNFVWPVLPEDIKHRNLTNRDVALAKSRTLITSEKSKAVNDHCTKRKLHSLYYFFHGFAALDWFRGFYALNYNKNLVKNYKYDYQSFNRIVTGDRAYRKTFVDQLQANDLLEHGAVSYGVTDDPVTEQRLVIDYEQLPGSASADIPDVDAFWHIVTETVFYYDKLHLTEKIFKPIVSKQPFMLLAAPGNLEYLRSYGFKTFEGIIDESYDSIKDNDARINAVVKQIKWYCDLSDDEKTDIQKQCEPITEHNFHHFYGKFREIITDELLDNTKKLFEDIGYNDTNVDYATVRKLLTS